MLLSNIKQQQHFSIRKLSVGVASILIGSTLLMFGSDSPTIVHAADENVDSDQLSNKNEKNNQVDTNKSIGQSDKKVEGTINQSPLKSNGVVTNSDSQDSINKKAGIDVENSDDSSNLFVPKKRSLKNIKFIKTARGLNEDKHQIDDANEKTATLHFMASGSTPFDPGTAIEIDGAPVESLAKGREGNPIKFGEDANQVIKKVEDMDYVPLVANYIKFDPVTGIPSTPQVYWLTFENNLADQLQFTGEDGVSPVTNSSDWQDITKYSLGRFGLHPDIYIWFFPPKAKKVTENIKYIFEDEDGNPISDPHKADTTQSYTLRGKFISGQTQWDQGKTTDPINITAPAGFKISSAVLDDEQGNPTNESVIDPQNPNQIKKFELTPKSKNIFITVTYRKLKVTPTPVQVITKIHYIDVTYSSKNSNFTPSEGVEIDHGIHTTTEEGRAGDQFTTPLWNYAKNGWLLVEENPQIEAKKLVKGMPTDLYIYLKKMINSDQPSSPVVKPKTPSEPKIPSEVPTRPNDSDHTNQQTIPVPLNNIDQVNQSGKTFHSNKIDGKEKRLAQAENINAHGEINLSKKTRTDIKTPSYKMRNSLKVDEALVKNKISSKNINQQQLPRTNEEKFNKLEIIGLGITVVITALSLVNYKRHKN